MNHVKNALRRIPLLGTFLRYIYWLFTCPIRINRLLDDVATLQQNLQRIEETSSASERHTTLTLDDLRSRTRTAIEMACKEACNVASVGRDTALCRVLTRYLMFVNISDRSLSTHMMLNGYWETWITQALVRYLQAGMYVADIGANVGYYSLLLADCVGPQGHLWAIEPNPEIFELMQQSMEINGLLGHATLVQKACSSSDNTPLILKVPTRYQGSATIATTAFETWPETEIKQFACETICLDTLVGKRGRLDFVKIDAEGAEQSIWAGMQGVLQQNPNIVIAMEFAASHYADARGFLNQITAQGFTLRCIHTDATIRDIDVDELLDTQDWSMLWLQRH